jgi:hypothetical protein
MGRMLTTKLLSQKAEKRYVVILRLKMRRATDRLAETQITQ